MVGFSRAGGGERRGCRARLQAAPSREKVSAAPVPLRLLPHLTAQPGSKPIRSRGRVARRGESFRRRRRPVSPHCVVAGWAARTSATEPGRVGHSGRRRFRPVGVIGEKSVGVRVEPIGELSEERWLLSGTPVSRGRNGVAARSKGRRETGFLPASRTAEGRDAVLRETGRADLPGDGYRSASGR